MDIKNTVVTDILSVATVHSPQGRTASIVDRGSYGLSFCISGQITYTHKGKSYVSDKDHAIILPMGQSYSLKGDAAGDFPVINFSSLYPICDTITVLEIRSRELLLKNYEAMKKLSMNESFRAKSISLFYEILHELSLQNDVGILGKAVKYIYENYHLSEITNQILAEECNISEVYFRRVFKQQFKITPKQFIIELRIQKAKQLLSEGKLKIWAIAEECGFSNAYHFCRIFKKHTGQTPLEYARQNLISEI